MEKKNVKVKIVKHSYINAVNEKGESAIIKNLPFERCSEEVLAESILGSWSTQWEQIRYEDGSPSRSEQEITKFTIYDKGLKEVEQINHIPEALKIFKQAFDNDPAFIGTYIDNITMAFKDEYYRKAQEKGMGYKFNTDDIHDIANQAAHNFVAMWMKDI